MSETDDEFGKYQPGDVVPWIGEFKMSLGPTGQCAVCDANLRSAVGVMCARCEDLDAEPCSLCGERLQRCLCPGRLTEESAQTAEGGDAQKGAA